MTVIASMVARSGTAHATDSLLTIRGPNGDTVPIEQEETKVIPVQCFRGALAYWGYAGDLSGTRTVDWLRDHASEATKHQTPEMFAGWLAQQLQAWLLSMGVASDTRHSIGVHFTAYEHVEDYWIPELFLISNFEDPSYARLRPCGVGYSRETFSTITGIPRSQDDSEPGRRRVVRAFLDAGRWLRFNNGDPLLFNPTADAVAVLLDLARIRGVAELDVVRLRQWTKLPVEIVAQMQRSFYRPEVRVVGGRIHDLAVTPTGSYSSKSGDAP